MKPRTNNKIDVRFEKLKIVMGDKGLGKFYSYTSKDGKIYPIIEMNIKMLEFDLELFCWVFNHELDHWRFYQNIDNWSKKDIDNEMKHAWPTKYNLKMITRLAKFELKYPIDSHKREFVFAKEKENETNDQKETKK